MGEAKGGPLSTLSVGYLDVPLASTDWNQQVAGKLGRDMRWTSQEGVNAEFLKAWTWAREVTKCAEQLAGAYIEGTPQRVECERLAKRHNGVWRAAMKMHRRDECGGMKRTAVAVRADAGDMSCPSYLARRAHNSVKAFKPVVLAAHRLGYYIGVGETRCYRADAPEEVRNLQLGYAGADIHIVPINATQVALRYTVAIAPGQPAFAALRDGLLDWEENHKALALACNEFGPERWTRLLVATCENKIRSRSTSGVFYGEAAKRLVIEAAKLDEPCFVADTARRVEVAQTNIANAVSLAREASSLGDLKMCVLAAQYARCYAEDMQAELKDEFAVSACALLLLAEYDVTGLADVPVLPEVRTALEKALASLPMPAPRTEYEGWQCVERVSIHGPGDIAKLVEWIKNG